MGVKRLMGVPHKRRKKRPRERPSRSKAPPDEISNRRRTTMHKFLMTAATLLAFATPAFAGNCEVNLDQHNQLKVGMRYSQVVEILGCEGDLTFSAKGA